MKKGRTAAAVIAVGLLFCGCSLFDRVPEGKAPEGAIVQNQPRRDFDERSAVNYMTTSLSIFLLTAPLKENIIAIDSDAATGRYAAKVLEELRVITATGRKELPADNVLRTRELSGRWEFRLFSKEKLIWSERLDLSLCKTHNTKKQGETVR